MAFAIAVRAGIHPDDAAALARQIPALLRRIGLSADQSPTGADESGELRPWLVVRPWRFPVSLAKLERLLEGAFASQPRRLPPSCPGLPAARGYAEAPAPPLVASAPFPVGPAAVPPVPWPVRGYRRRRGPRCWPSRHPVKWSPCSS